MQIFHALLQGGTTSTRKSRQVSSKLDPFREYLLARMLSGYSGSRSILKEFMHPFRVMAKERATVRFETPPGRQAQVDWAPSRSHGASDYRVS